jgi:quercetin dioxygenase-like cupin family protein
MVNILKKHLPLLFLCLAAAASAGTTPDPNTVQVETLAKAFASWDGTPLPAYPLDQPEITILRLHIPAGMVLPMHKHPVINAGVVISGELTVVTEADETLVLRAGDAIVEVVEKWHYGKNDGEVPVDIIVFYAGTNGVPITVIRETPE